MLAPVWCSDKRRLRIHAAPNRKALRWVGGWILASLAAFKSMWVTREEYEEHGAKIEKRRERRDKICRYCSYCTQARRA